MYFTGQNVTLLNSPDNSVKIKTTKAYSID